MAPTVDLNYQLPHVVEALRSGWLTLYQSAAVVSSLLAGISVSLLSAINDDWDDSIEDATRGARNFLYFESFASILLNAASTASSLILIDQLAALPRTAACLPELPNKGYVLTSDHALLLRFGVFKYWRYCVWFWLITLCFGITCPFGQVLTYMWISTKVSKTVRVTITTFAAIFMFFVVIFLVRVTLGQFRCCGGKPSQLSGAKSRRDTERDPAGSTT